MSRLLWAEVQSLNVKMSRLMCVCVCFSAGHAGRSHSPKILPSDNPLLLHKDDVLSLTCRYWDSHLRSQCLCPLAGRSHVDWQSFVDAFHMALYEWLLGELTMKPRGLCSLSTGTVNTHHSGNQVCCPLDIEEFIVLHHFVGLQGMFRNSYLFGAMLPYMATMALGVQYSVSWFSVTGMRARS